MKLYIFKAHLMAVVFLLMTISGCDRSDGMEFPVDNVVYIQAAKDKNTDNLLLKNKDTEITKVIQAALAYPADKEIQVRYSVSPQLVNAYKQANNIECEMLPENFYSLSAPDATIPKGEVRSTEVAVTFKSLKGISKDKIYILPVSMESATNIDILNGAKTIYYVIRKSAPITTVANIANNYLSINFANPAVLSNLTKLTMEALVRISDFDSNGKVISTVMGVEGYFLIRIGDAGFYKDQIQFAGSSGNFPSQDASKRLKRNEWQHIALTYDRSTQEMVIYVNGIEQSRGTRTFSPSSINLARSDFYIGKSYDNARDMRGEISECRIWSVVRTKDQIADNIYDVDPRSEGLAAYWKFDEGAGTAIKDQTGNGNDATAASPLTWIPVSLPADK